MASLHSSGRSRSHRLVMCDFVMFYTPHKHVDENAEWKFECELIFDSDQA